MVKLSEVLLSLSAGPSDHRCAHSNRHCLRCNQQWNNLFLHLTQIAHRIGGHSALPSCEMQDVVQDILCEILQKHEHHPGVALQMALTGQHPDEQERRCQGYFATIARNKAFRRAAKARRFVSSENAPAAFVAYEGGEQPLPAVRKDLGEAWCIDVKARLAHLQASLSESLCEAIENCLSDRRLAHEPELRQVQSPQQRERERKRIQRKRAKLERAAMTHKDSLDLNSALPLIQFAPLSGRLP